MDATRRDALLREYSEVGAAFRLLTDIRFKLLAFLPIAAAAAAAALKRDDALGIQGFGLSLFGLVVTLGLATYNARNDQLYDELVARAASIERSLGLPDGYFANRPRPWLDVPFGKLHWSIDHRTGVTIIYAASVALWASGVLAPTLAFVRRVFPVTHPAIGVNIFAIALAIGLTVLGLLVIGDHKKRRAKALRAWAAEAVKTAAGLQVGRVAQCEKLLSLCEKLSGEERETIRSRAQFYTERDPESVAYYLPSSGAPEVSAAHVVALLTDLPARWLFDCATNRRGTLTADTDRQPRLVHALAENWWLLLLRGIAAIIFGVLAFAWPGITLLTLILFYGAYALADGVLAIIAAIAGGAPPRWWLAIVGLLGIAAGLLTFLMPSLSALVLLFFIAGWAMATGVLQIIGAIQLRKEIDNEWLLILGGVISVLFGIGMISAPGAGALALVWVIGTYVVIMGGLLVALAFRLRKRARSTPEPGKATRRAEL
jgi:uncharacterized membrane protein HdeD (DUF308 family)